MIVTQQTKQDIKIKNEKISVQDLSQPSDHEKISEKIKVSSGEVKLSSGEIKISEDASVQYTNQFDKIESPSKLLKPPDDVDGFKK